MVERMLVECRIGHGMVLLMLLQELEVQSSDVWKVGVGGSFYLN